MVGDCNAEKTATVAGSCVPRETGRIPPGAGEVEASLPLAVTDAGVHSICSTEGILAAAP